MPNIDEMGELLNKGDPHNSDLSNSDKVLARARTLVILRRVGEARKSEIMRFLSDAGLILRTSGESVPPIPLTSAELCGVDLNHVHLNGAVLGGANLRGANLQAADLGCAGLGRADLRNANLTDTVLGAADLRDADLRNADLTNTWLSGTDLRGADLRGTMLSDEELRFARTDSNTQTEGESTDGGDGRL